MNEITEPSSTQIRRASTIRRSQDVERVRTIGYGTFLEWALYAVPQRRIRRKAIATIRYIRVQRLPTLAVNSNWVHRQRIVNQDFMIDLTESHPESSWGFSNEVI